MATLVRTMATLRSRYGCPWDRKQTHASLAPFLVEEAYEAIDTIERHQTDELAGELGDVLFQCVFHAQIAAEAGRFDLADAIKAIIAKLVRRHPHVFASSGRPLTPAARRRRTARSSEAVLTQWEAIKAAEQTSRGETARVLAGVPRALPALLRAHEIGTRVAAVGFDWPQVAGVVDKIDEEVQELRAAVTESPARAADELGDLLFSIANLARKLGIEPEAALRAANDKFTKRFEALEDDFAARSRSIHGAGALDLDEAWNRAKAQTTARLVGGTARSRPRVRRRSPKTSAGR
jgi:ATP diphosphatase